MQRQKKILKKQDNLALNIKKFFSLSEMADFLLTVKNIYDTVKSSLGRCYFVDDKALEKATKLEGILRGFLECHYGDFGVKANDDLLNQDWKSPINFALGYKYAMSGRNDEVKKEIEYFLGNVLIGKSIADIIKNYENEGLSSEEEAYEKVDEIIDEFEKILKM